MTVFRFAEVRSVRPGQTRLLMGGAKGIRTPDLLIANETRYQLRHSPMRFDRSKRLADSTTSRPAEPSSDQPEAACRASPSPASDWDFPGGASAVTGCCWRADDVTPGPERSMVRTVRGASGFDT